MTTDAIRILNVLGLAVASQGEANDVTAEVEGVL